MSAEVGDPASEDEGSRVVTGVREALGDVTTVAVPQEVLDRVADITGVTLSLPLPLPCTDTDGCRGLLELLAERVLVGLGVPDPPPGLVALNAGVGLATAVGGAVSVEDSVATEADSVGVRVGVTVGKDAEPVMD